VVLNVHFFDQALFALNRFHSGDPIPIFYGIFVKNSFWSEMSLK